MIYVGIDITSQKHDFYMISDQGEVYNRRAITIPNTVDGYKKLHKAIKDFCGATKDYNVHIGLESAGFYHKNIISYLFAQDYEVMIINPLLIHSRKKSHKIHVQKNDNLDAIAICDYLQDRKTIFKPYTSISYHTETLKALSHDRFSLVEKLRLAKINIYKLIIQLFPEYLDLFSNIYQCSALDIISKYPNTKKLAKAHEKTISSMIHKRCKTTANEIISAAKTSVGMQDEYLSFQLIQGIKRLNSIQSEIDEYDLQIKKYVETINTNILTIPGISYITAGLILGEIGDIKNYKHSDNLISFAGLDVKVYESGKYKAKYLSISKKGSVYLRYALYQAAKVCWKCDQMFNKYYLKKQSENKHYYVILGHIQKKLIRVIFSVLKNNKPYSP